MPSEHQSTLMAPSSHNTRYSVKPANNMFEPLDRMKSHSSFASQNVQNQFQMPN